MKNYSLPFLFCFTFLFTLSYAQPVVTDDEGNPFGIRPEWTIINCNTDMILEWEYPVKSFGLYDADSLDMIKAIEDQLQWTFQTSRIRCADCDIPGQCEWSIHVSGVENLSYNIDDGGLYDGDLPSIQVYGGRVEITYSCTDCAELNDDGNSGFNPPDASDPLCDLLNIPEEPINCGEEDYWLIDMTGTDLGTSDGTAVVDSIASKVKGRALQLGWECAGCDDASYSGCELEVEVQGAETIDLNLNDNGAFSVNGEVFVLLSCSLCAQEPPSENESEGSSGGASEVDGSFHDLETQIYCGETSYHHAQIQGTLIDAEDDEKAYQEVIRIVEDNHNALGFGCKLCPDGTERCELEVLFVWAYSDENELGYEPMIIDTVPGYYLVPAQEIWIKFKCLTCDEEIPDDGEGGIEDNPDDTDPDLGDGTDDGLGNNGGSDDGPGMTEMDEDAFSLSGYSTDEAVINSTDFHNYGTTSAALTSIHAYPNPFKDRITISCSEHENPLRLEIRSSGGVMVFQQGALNARTLEVDLTHLAAGIYLVMIYDDVNGQGIKSLKLIKQK